LNGGLEMVLASRGVTFHSLVSNEKEMGVIAQEAGTVSPLLSGQGANGRLFVKIIGYIAILIEAVKALHTRIEKLESK
jgi:hypothetical protein